MRCPYAVDCDYTTKNLDGDGVFHLVIIHKLTVVGARLYEWEPARVEVRA